MIIREEQQGDVEIIRALTQAAFKGMAFSDQTEAAIVDGLRATGGLALSLVAQDADHITGHIAFSPVKIDGQDQGWYGLGPVSVWPDRQRQGIGSALIREGLKRLQARGASGCVLLGDPAYYGRFGFRCDRRLTYAGAPEAYFQCLAFSPTVPEGPVRYHRAFEEA